MELTFGNVFAIIGALALGSALSGLFYQRGKDTWGWKGVGSKSYRADRARRRKDLEAQRARSEGRAGVGEDYTGFYEAKGDDATTAAAGAIQRIQRGKKPRGRVAEMKKKCQENPKADGCEEWAARQASDLYQLPEVARDGGRRRRRRRTKRGRRSSRRRR